MVTTLSRLGLTPQIGIDQEITDICVDSRRARPGSLFAALPGVNTHGAEYIEQVLEAGAVAILTDPAGLELTGTLLQDRDDVSVVVVEDARQALAGTAALFFAKQPTVMTAVTGTNGKTSVSSFTRQIWQLLGQRAINIGTTGVEGDWQAPCHHTTPEPITLHRLLSDAAENGITHGAMEASSHGLEQKRLDGVRIAAAAFTNFTQDHLDYHETFEAYFNAKAGLFERVLVSDGVAVINIDDAKGIILETRCVERGVSVLRVGRSDGADIRVVSQRFTSTGQDLRIDFLGNIYQVHLDLVGGFQVENVLAAAGLVIACGADADEVFSCLPELVGVRGRMEKAAVRNNGGAVFVDYAHTPDAVETAIKALRPHIMGRIIAIVGAGGDRDRTKRPLMGKAADQNADLVIVTDDNPRTEDPAAIRAEVLLGAPNALEVADRAKAILQGVDALQSGDGLVICGKGHETYQIIGEDVYPFDDLEQASLCVAALDGSI